MSQLISQRAYARSRDVRGLPGGTLRAVQKAIAAGRIRLVDGKIDPETADLQWDRNTDPDQQKRGASGGALENDPATVTDAARPSESVGASPAALMQTSASTPSVHQVDQANRIREAARADAARTALLEYELAEKRGQLVRRDEVRKAAFDKARIARNALLAIPDRLAPLVAAETDPTKVHALLAAELRRVCAELAAGEDTPTRQ